MLLSRANLEVYQAASRNKHDMALRQVRIEADGTTVASDGHILVVVSPASSGRLASGGLSIQVDHASEVLRALKAGSDAQVAMITKINLDSGVLELTIPSKTRIQRIEAKLVRSRFPAWREPLAEAVKVPGLIHRRAAFQASDIDRALKTVRAISGGDPVVFMEEVAGGIMFRAGAKSTGQQVLALINSMDTGDKWPERSAWERRVFRVRKRVGC